jgi:hypothetical protein
MSTHRDDIAADLPAVLYNTDEYAESATYNTAGGSALPVSLLPMDGESAVYDHLQLDASEQAVKIIKTDVSTVTLRKDTIDRADGSTWRVIEYAALNAFEYVLGLQKEV